MRSFVLLNNLLQIIRHLRERYQSDLHRAIGRFANHRVYFREALSFFQIIFAKLCAATFLSLQRRARDRFSKVNTMIRKAADGTMEVRLVPLPEMPDYLKQIIEE